MASPPQGENTGDGDYESVTTEELNNAADGQAWETLKIAGFEKGDDVPIWVHPANNNSSTSSTSPRKLLSVSEIGLLDPDGYDADGDFRVGWQATLSQDTAGEDVTCRMFDGNSSTAFTNTEVTHTGTAFTAYRSPTESITLGNFTERIEFRPRAEVSGGTGTVRNYSNILYLRL
jgi:hypothetical protein